MSMLARASLPACFAFLTLSYTLLRVLLTARVHRPMASTKVFATWSKAAQSQPMVPAIEAAAKDAAAGGSGDVQGGRLDEGRRVGQPPPPLDRSRQLLGPRSCPDALVRCTDGLTIPTDRIADGMTVGRAEESHQASYTRVQSSAYVAHVDLLLYM